MGFDKDFQKMLVSGNADWEPGWQRKRAAKAAMKAAKKAEEERAIAAGEIPDPKAKEESGDEKPRKKVSTPPVNFWDIRCCIADGSYSPQAKPARKNAKADSAKAVKVQKVRSLSTTIIAGTLGSSYVYALQVFSQILRQAEAFG